jgi:hypothetical protein
MVFYGDVMMYQPSFGEPKRVRVTSEGTDEEGFVHIKFMERSDYLEFQEMGIGEVVDEIGEIVRVPEAALRPEYNVPSPNNLMINMNRVNIPPNVAGGARRRRRPSRRTRARRSVRRSRAVSRRR